MRINTNVAALNSYNQLNNTQNNLSKSLERLSSGKRINSASDDAAGLAISEKMGGQVRGLAQAQRNAQDGISMIQTAEGALKESHAILQRMRELSVQSANDTNTDADRVEIQEEVNQLTNELTRISETTEFNTQKLLDGTLKNTFQIGSNEGQNMNLDISEMSADELDVIENTVSMGSAGNGVNKVEADTSFKIEDYQLTAEEGGAVGAELKSNDVVDTNGYVEEVETKYSAGVSGNNHGDFELKDNEITVSNTSGFNWDSIDTQGGSGVISIEKDTTNDTLKVTIAAEDSSGTELDISDDFAVQDADGNYVYDAHGVSFEMSETAYDDLANADILEVDLSEAVGSGTTKDATGSIATVNTWDSMNLGSGGNTEASMTDDAIKFDSSDSNWIESAEGENITVSGTGLNSGDGVITVTVSGSTGTISQDTFTFSGVQTEETFSYDNHGISFELAVNDASGFNINDEITKVDNSIDMGSSDNTLKFNITDSEGASQNLTVDFEDGKQSADDIVKKINDEYQAATSGSGEIASYTAGDEYITLAAEDTGSDSTIDIETMATDSSSSDIFKTSDEVNGDDISVDFTLSEIEGSDTFTVSGFNPVNQNSFKIASGQVEFSLGDFDSLEDVDVEDEFSASNFSRTVTGIDVSSQEAADSAISTIDDAIQNVSSERSKLGAVQNRLEHTINNLGAAEENLTAAESRISDVDMAQEMMKFTKNQILSQAGTAMMAQANQLPQGVLQLLG